jgi:hypothetical protein
MLTRRTLLERSLATSTALALPALGGAAAQTSVLERNKAVVTALIRYQASRESL